MIILDKSNYYKALESLQMVYINHLFADAVLQGHIRGTVYVDQPENPSTFYVVHPYGMSLLFGDTTNEKFNSWLLGHALNIFKTRDRYEWLQAYPETWNKQIASEWEEHLRKSGDNVDGATNVSIEENTRVNFKFNKAAYLDFKAKHPLASISTIRTDGQMFENMQGSVIPSRFWDNAADFSNRAVAFSVMDGDRVAATAFSAFVIGNQLEIGIETSESYRGKGYALAVCMALIDYCLEHNYIPVWGCKLENMPSFLLARKLGFEPTLYWPFYRLNC
jgi:hypothetical protein